MSVLDRSSLEQSPLADLHAIASELSIDGYRRLRRAELVDAIIAKQDGGAPAGQAEEPGEAPDEGQAQPTADELREAEAAEERSSASGRRRGRRGGRGRASEQEAEDERGEEQQPRAEKPAKAEKPGKAEKGAKAKREPKEDKPSEPETPAEDEMVAGVIELMGNGSAFVRVCGPDPSDDDVYVSSAQVKRCELVTGDRVEGPKRAPRRSERFASLIRVDTVNGRPASELADGAHFDDLTAAFASEPLTLGGSDPTLAAVELLAPFGKGSRVAIVGGARSGKSHLLGLLAGALASRTDLTVQVVLAGVRPEELGDWDAADVAPAAKLSFAASQEAQNAAVDTAIEQGRRLAARGAHAAVLIDSLASCSPQVARRALASARSIAGGGSLTVIATAAEPFGGETTVIALDTALASAGRFPALDASASWTMRPELMIGAEGAEAIARLHAQAQ